MIDVRYDEMLESGELIGSVVDTNENLDIIRGRYGDLDNDCGCYCNGEWLSVRDIVKLIVDYSYPAD